MRRIWRPMLLIAVVFLLVSVVSAAPSAAHVGDRPGVEPTTAGLRFVGADGLEQLARGSVLTKVRMQLADDSFHAVRIAFRQKVLEIVEGFDRSKLPCRRDVDDDRLVIA